MPSSAGSGPAPWQMRLCASGLQSLQLKSRSWRDATTSAYPDPSALMTATFPGPGATYESTRSREPSRDQSAPRSSTWVGSLTARASVPSGRVIHAPRDGPSSPIAVSYRLNASQPAATGSVAVRDAGADAAGAAEPEAADDLASPAAVGLADDTGPAGGPPTPPHPATTAATVRTRIRDWPKRFRASPSDQRRTARSTGERAFRRGEGRRQPLGRPRRGSSGPGPGDRRRWPASPEVVRRSRAVPGARRHLPATSPTSRRRP